MPRITRALVKQLAEAPAEREVTVTDAEVRGLVLRIRPGARPAYLFRYEFGGRRRKLAIGLTTEFEPDDARRLARAFRERLLLGEDPAKAREEARTAPTVAELSDRYMAEHSRPNKKPGSIQNDIALWRMYILPRIGTLQVRSVEERHILQIRNSFQGHPARAASCLALLSHAFKMAEVWRYRPQNSNPCRFVKRPKIRRRDRTFSPEDLGRLGQALREHEAARPAACHLFRALLFTGARLNEVRLARASQLDLHRRILLLPDSKRGQDAVTLSDLAIGIFTSIDRGESPWLIPGDKPGKPVGDPWGAWAAICKTAGIEGFRIHDLRHAFATYAHQFGADIYTVSKLLRHGSTSMSERYTHAIPVEVESARNRTADGLSGLLSGDSSATPDS